MSVSFSRPENLSQSALTTATSLKSQKREVAMDLFFQSVMDD